MCEAEKRWLEVRPKEWEAIGIRKGIGKGFKIKAIVSEESIKKLLMKA